MSNLLDAFFRFRLDALNQSGNLHVELLDEFESVRAEAIQRRCMVIQALMSEFVSVQQAEYLRHYHTFFVIWIVGQVVARNVHFGDRIATGKGCGYGGNKAW